LADINCVRCEESGPAIQALITFAGAFGDDIRGRVCQACWEEWSDMQIKVLNEFRLHMGEASHRQKIQDYAFQFFRMDGGDGDLGAGPEGGLVDTPEDSAAEE
jgi:Fe-S cluster biosynthesis and repair protein YggX